MRAKQCGLGVKHIVKSFGHLKSAPMVKGKKALTRVEALLFEFGGTLAFLDYELLADEFSRPGRRIDAGTLERAEYAGRAAIDRALMSPATDGPERVSVSYFRSWMKAAGVPAEETDELQEQFREIHSKSSLWRVIRPGVREALDKFHAAGFRLAVVSNAQGNVEGDAV